MDSQNKIHSMTSVKDLEKLYGQIGLKISFWKFIKVTFTWFVPLFFLILVFGHEYGAFFLIPMVILGLPGLKISEIMVEKYQDKQRQCWSRLGDLERSLP